MTNEQRKKKQEIFKKIIDLVELASTLGAITQDEQTTFLSESIKLVLAAGSDPNDCRKFSEHCINYIYEKQMQEGEIEAKEHLISNLTININ